MASCVFFVVLHIVKQTNYLMIFLDARAREREGEKESEWEKERSVFSLVLFKERLEVSIIC